MMIAKIKIKNWKSHEETEFDFSSGTNALIGIMGSGKSSVMDAICFALFGTFPMLQSKKIKLDDIIMKKPNEKNKAEVEVAFQLNGDNYFVRRVIEKGRGTSYSEVRKNENLIESPNSQRVTESIENILKVNYELFSKAIYSEQNALDYFLTIPKGQRMKKIDELLMINKFENARSASVSLANKLLERKLARQNLLDQMPVEEIENSLAELKDSLKQIDADRSALKKEFSDIAVEKNKLEVEISELQKIKENFEILKRDEQGINSAINEINTLLRVLEDVAKLETKEEMEKKFDELESDINDLEAYLNDRKQNYEKISSVIAQSKAKLDFLKSEKIDRLEKEIDEKIRIEEDAGRLRNLVGADVLKELDLKKNALQRLIGEVEELKAKIKNIDEAIHQLSVVEGKCPVCDSRLTEERRNLLIEQKQLEITNLQEKLNAANERKQLSEEGFKKLEDATRRLSEMLIVIKDFDDVKADFDKSKRLFSELSELTIKTDNQLSQLRKEISETEAELKKVTNDKEKIEILLVKKEDYDEKRIRLGELIKERKHAEVKIQELEQSLSERDLTGLENQLKETIAKEKEIETKISGLEQIVQEKDIRIKDYEAKLAAFNKQKDELQKLEQLIKSMRIFGKALEQTQISLRKEFVEAVNYAMNDLWQSLYPYKDFVSIRLNVEEGDYILQLQERSGSWINVDGTASGGERSIAALALRIAFALVLAPQLPWLVLDEPTHNLDTKAVEDLAETLRERIGKFVDQVFLITHDEKLEDAVSGSMYRLVREKEKDGVTKTATI